MILTCVYVCHVLVIVVVALTAARDGKTSFRFAGALPPEQDGSLRQSARLCLLILLRLALFFSGLIPGSIPDSFYMPRFLTFEYSPGYLNQKGTSGSVAAFVTLFCIFTGARLKRMLAIVGVLSLRGKIIEVSAAGSHHNA